MRYHHSGARCATEPAFEGKAPAMIQTYAGDLSGKAVCVIGSGDAYEPGKDASLMGWRVNARAGLPVWLTVCAQK